VSERVLRDEANHGYLVPAGHSGFGFEINTRKKIASGGNWWYIAQQPRENVTPG
jgi:hypothetical protein